MAIQQGISESNVKEKATAMKGVTNFVDRGNKDISTLINAEKELWNAFQGVCEGEAKITVLFKNKITYIYREKKKDNKYL